MWTRTITADKARWAGTELTCYETQREMLAAAMSPSTKAKEMLDGSLRDSPFVGRYFESVEDIATAAETTWQPGMEMLDNVERQLTDAIGDLRPKDLRRRGRWSEDHGDEVCRDRLQSGAPFWRTSERMEVAAPRMVTVFANLSTRWSVTAGDVTWRGAAAVVLTSLLETYGYRVQLIAARSTFAGFNANLRQVTACVLKQHDEPLDRSSLCNAVSVWWHRSIYFGALGAQAGHRKLGSGRGCTGETLDINAADMAELSADETQFYFEHIWNFADAVSAVKNAIARLA